MQEQQRYVSVIAKDINIGVTRMLKTLIKSLKPHICLHQFKSPNPTFLDICLRSRFVFDAGEHETSDFVHDLPRDMNSLTCYAETWVAI